MKELLLKDKQKKGDMRGIKSLIGGFILHMVNKNNK